MEVPAEGSAAEEAEAAAGGLDRDPAGVQAGVATVGSADAAAVSLEGPAAGVAGGVVLGRIARPARVR